MIKVHIVNLKYLTDEQTVAKFRPAHREFLDIGYSKNIFIASGPKEDKSGGIILALGNIEDIKELLKSDPFYINSVAEYSFNSFDAVKYANILKDFSN